MRRTVVVLVGALLVASVGAAALPAVGGEPSTAAESPEQSTDSTGWTSDVELLPGRDDPNVSAPPSSSPGESRDPGESATGPSPVNASQRDPGFMRGDDGRVVTVGTDRTDTDGDGVSDRREQAMETDPRDPDTDGDGLSDGRERELGTDPRSADTDGDGVSDSRELETGTSPVSVDADGDGVPDRRERAVGTDPFQADTDDDGLPDGLELDIGTDPTVADTDGDGLPDGWEVYNETASGASLSGSDPLSVDLYVQVDYVRGVSRPDDDFYASVRAEFTQMPVDNPDNTTGIDLHVREGGTINASARFTGDNFWALKERFYQERLGPRAEVYHHVLFTRFGSDHAGYGEVGGHFSVVAAGAPTETQQFVVVHELLHNVVGPVDAPGACDGDRKHYCEGGWLRPRITPGEGEFLPEPIATEIETQGFEADGRSG